MNPETAKWVSKAEGDFHTARRELRARKAPNYDAACFHAQQGAEKYLKAVLVEANQPFSKTHDLLLLLDGCLPFAPLLDASRPALAILKNFAVHIRYPGDDATRAEARDVVHRAEAVRIWVCPADAGSDPAGYRAGSAERSAAEAASTQRKPLWFMRALAG